MFTHVSRLQSTLPLALGSAVIASTLAVASYPGADREGPPPLPQVTAAAAVSRNVTEWDEFTGRLEAVQSVGVRPRVSGLIAAVSFQEGSLVRQGQVLFELDDRPFQAQVARLRAELAQAAAARDRAGSEQRRADRLSTENAMSLEERERRAAPPLKRPRSTRPSRRRSVPPSSISSSRRSSRRSTAASAARW